MTLRFLAAAAAALGLLCATTAHAQGAPAPIGVWSTDDGNEQMVIAQSGTCQFTGRSPQGNILVVGSCSWNPSSAGGILTIMANTTGVAPAPVYYNIVWVDQNTITVYGDVMHRRGN